ncbi:MAG TPA: aldehyde dehydrogenase family protein, partial [Sphingomonas sp.]
MTFTSANPATGETLWTGEAAGPEQVSAALAKAHAAFEGWSVTPLEARIAFVRAYKAALERNVDALARAISQETGKPAWEGRQEAATMVAKVETSIKAQAERAG